MSWLDRSSKALLGFTVILMVFEVGAQVGMRNRQDLVIQDLKGQVDFLKEYNATVKRARTWPAAEVDTEACDAASKTYGVPPRAIAAVRRSENGRSNGLALGAHAKSLEVVRNQDATPPTWQYFEAAKVLRDCAVRFCFEGPRRREFQEYLAKTYSCGPDAPASLRWKWMSWEKKFDTFSQAPKRPKE